MKDKTHGAVEIDTLSQTLAGGQEHSSMAVVAAGMHFATVAAGVRQATGFDDRQRVHIGSQANNALALSFAQRRDDAGSR